MKRWVAMLALLALVWAVMVSIALIFLPIYTGVSRSSANPEPVTAGATLIQVNGYWVLILMAVPIALSGLGVVAAIRILRNRSYGIHLLWMAAVALAILVFIAGFSIGTFYAPSALLMLVSAVLATKATPPAPQDV